MTVRRPTLEQMMDIVDSFGMSMTPGARRRVPFADGRQLRGLRSRSIRCPTKSPSSNIRARPAIGRAREENPLNAWYVKTDIQGAPTGKLKGKTVAVKDNVCVAGVPMMNGSSTLEGYVPNIDATIVTRLLDAGATIKGKAHCELFCLSGGSHTGALGPGAQPLQTRLFRRRLIVGERRAGRGRRGRFGDRRRPGRIDPHALLVLRHLRHEADARPRALHRRDADRIDDRSHRPDDGDGRRQRADAGGARGARRPRPEAIRAEGRRLHGGARSAAPRA